MWALRRQFFYALGVIVVVGGIGLIVGFSFFHHPPTCSDRIKNQDELGIDCGGVCVKLCTAPRISALWARAVLAAPGVYHAVALVRNPESNAGTYDLPYTFSLYDASNILIAERSGDMYILPGEVAPLFEPSIITGKRVPVRTFVEFGQAVWEKGEAPKNPLRVVSQSLDQTALRLTALVQNTSVYPVTYATVTALLYDEAGNVVQASQTTVSNIPSEGSKQVAFTWQQPFERPVVRAEITPRVSP